MATRDEWIAGARPKTLPAAIAPVLVGSGIAIYEKGFSFIIALLALVVSLSLQIGVNYSNDYSDGIRGTDNNRVGPVRLVGQQLASAESVKNAAFKCFGLAAVAGLLMMIISKEWILLPIGIASIAAAWFYTGGKNPYGYAGFGELFVFVFFGLVAVIGTSYTQTHHVTMLSLLGGIACGSLSMAILVANNLRDIHGDTVAGKNTLAVRLGDKRTRELYRTCIMFGFLPAVVMMMIPNGPQFAYFGLFWLLTARRPLMAVAGGAKGPELIEVLAGTSRVLLLFSASLSMAIAMSPN